jgi:hypothetical protein
MQRLRLAAYGNSLYLEGIAACLGCHLGLKVLLIDPDAPHARERLDKLKPDVIAFELYTADPAVPMGLLQQRPDLVIVVLDPDSEEILVLSSQRAQPTTAAELGDVLFRTLAQPA